jgi:hypothetical protein
MRALGITLSLLGPALTFLIGGIVTAFAILGSPFTVASPQGYLVTALGAAPGVIISLIAVLLGIRSAQQKALRGWLILLGAWALLVVIAAVVVAVGFNSNDFPWFFPLIALPLANLIYWIFND